MKTELKFHNPDNLETAGDPPWRFTVEGEQVQARVDECWDYYRWQLCGYRDGEFYDPVKVFTYRTKRPLPAPQPGGGGEAAEQVVQQWCRNDGGGIETFEERIPLPKNYIPGEYERHEWPRCSKCGTYYETEDGPCTACTPTPPIALPVRAEATFPNGCERTIPQALRYLAENPRPVGGCDNYNSEHLYQLADEMEEAVKNSAALSRELEEARREIKLLQDQIGWENNRHEQ